MQHETEIELRAANESLQTRLRMIERTITNKDEEVYTLHKEVQTRDLDIKNLGLVE
jgi:hypothetical protein